MENNSWNGRKLFNDPVYGLIFIPGRLVFNLIEHPYFQRLRRIKQLGLTHLVYPGAMHTRFQHSIGAMHLMAEALETIRSKGHELTSEESDSALAAMLLHDIGHGPFSHALENSIITGVRHETISMVYMSRLNEAFDGQLSTAMEIFSNVHRKAYLHQLVSGQLDMDRLDYLKRDSFYCGVAEGIVNDDRIIKTINVNDGLLVVDAKGIYSVEKFIIARRLMYWQVYLHKTVIAAESLLIRILRRAKELSRKGHVLFGSPSFLFFLQNEVDSENFMEPEVISHFSRIDDFDVFTSIKNWINHEDTILSTLSQALVNRQLYRIEMQNQPFDESYVAEIRRRVMKKYSIGADELDYYTFLDTTSNFSYDPVHTQIGIVLKSGQVLDFTEASEQFNLTVLTEPVTRHIMGYPKEISPVGN